MAEEKDTLTFTSCLKRIYIILDEEEFDIYPKYLKSNSILHSLVFTENIKNTVIGGEIIFFDIYDWTNQKNISNFKKIGIEYETKNIDNSSRVDLKKIEFNIFSIAQVTKKPQPILVEGQEYTLLRFDFVTDDIFTTSVEGEFFPPGKDFVGFISTNGNQQIPGLVNEIFNKLSIEKYEIEPTYNGIWIKSNEISYPWSKNKGQISLSNLMSYICNYSVSKSNPNAVNYFLWRDVDKYYFKSVEKIITDFEDAELEKITFNNKNELTCVRDIDVMREADIYELSSSNIFQSFYEKIIPNYDEYYLDFVDTNLSFTREIIDFNYQRDSETWKKIEQYKLIPDTVNTSVFVEDLNTPSLAQSVSQTDNKQKTAVQSLNADDAIYGYYNKNRLNTPFFTDWDYIGKTFDSRWSSVNYIPQFDMTDLDVTTFYKIHKEIREPLREKRTRYSYLKNIKRKWEVYRCSVCCLGDRLGGIKDEEIFRNINKLPLPNKDPNYIKLFGATGVFGDTDLKYRIVAAGSFSDVYNYDVGQTANRGLTLSYDLESDPYNQTIQQFYNLNPESTNYKTYVLDYSLKRYILKSINMQKNLDILNLWIEKLPNYISQAESWWSSKLVECNEENGDCSQAFGVYTNRLLSCQFESTPEIRNPEGYGFLEANPIAAGTFYGFWDVYNNSAGPFTVEPETGQINAPSFVFSCSSEDGNPFVQNFIYQYRCPEELVVEPGGPSIEELVDFDNTNFESFRSINFDYKFTDENNNFIFLDDYYEQLYNEMKQNINQKKQICSQCINPILLEIELRNSKKLRALLTETKKINDNFISKVQNYITKWNNNKTEYDNRKAFFISKKEDKIDDNLNNILSANLSLYNIKKIERKPIRGSRYEVLAKEKGITSNISEYLHKIFFDDIEVDIGITGNHPYYDQTYTDEFGESAFQSLFNPKVTYEVENNIDSSLPPFQSQFASPPSKWWGGGKSKMVASLYPEHNIHNLQPKYISNVFLDQMSKTSDISKFKDRFNIYDPTITSVDLNKKPPNLKKEEISSYVRIEFKKPIGLEYLADFPKGFIRNAGYEYFLPYIVNITPGPNGRQTIRNNITVIGMDPYGFDVAMKKIPFKYQDGKNYWWSNTSLHNYCEMQLWPEKTYENKKTYYTTSYLNNEQQFFNNYNNAKNEKSINSDPKITRIYPRTYVDITQARSTYATSPYQVNFLYNDTSIQTNGKYTYNHNNSYSTNYLLTSHKRKNVVKNWWDFSLPASLLTELVMEAFDQFSNVYTENYLYVKSTFNTWTQFYFEGFGQNYEGVWENLKFANTSQDVIDMIDRLAENKIYLHYPENQFLEANNVNTTKKFEQFFPDVERFFEDKLEWFLSGEHIMYRPGLLTEDVWKYDLSGYAEYGLIDPPVVANHGDIFDNNFGAQFMVFTRAGEDFCTKNNLKCINPKGEVYTTGCPDNDPYCNCPAQNRKPKNDKGEIEEEPSYIELFDLYEELRECKLISEKLGNEWLGCEWSNPNSPHSCNCPEVGDKYLDYLNYNRTYATFWSTPPKTMLLRTSQIGLLFSNTLQITIPRNDKIKVGNLIMVDDVNPDSDMDQLYRRFSGKWLVTEIIHKFMAGQQDYMVLTLNRDSRYHDPN